MESWSVLGPKPHYFSTPVSQELFPWLTNFKFIYKAT